MLELVDQGCGIDEPAFVAGIGEIQVPVLLELAAAVAHLQIVARRNHPDSLEERPTGTRAEGVEEEVDALAVGACLDHPRGQKRLDLRAPEQPAVDLGIVQRADSDPVAAQDQRPRLAVPEGDGELAAGPSKHLLAQVFVEVDPELGIAPR